MTLKLDSPLRGQTCRKPKAAIVNSPNHQRANRTLPLNLCQINGAARGELSCPLPQRRSHQRLDTRGSVRLLADVGPLQHPLIALTLSDTRKLRVGLKLRLVAISSNIVKRDTVPIYYGQATRPDRLQIERML